MKETILQKAGETFLKFGFKSVTMDDIANELAISKKTIYKFFSNKQDLVDQTVSAMHEDCFHAIDGVCSLGINAIHENFEVKKIFKDLLKNTDTSPMYQLQKYYPMIFKQVHEQQFEAVKGCIVENLKRGITGGYYRKDIDIDLITRFYFSGNISLTNHELFPNDIYEMSSLKDTFLEYHVRAIATEKGLNTLKNILKR